MGNLNVAFQEKYVGDDIIGLSRAFVCAGSPVVMVYLWRVSDVSTAEFMKNFYQELKTGKSETQALREAQLKQWRNTPIYIIGRLLWLLGIPETDRTSLKGYYYAIL
ncbi:MAG: CHAT domain-containing protein [Vulcanimicrobiota bacterium]